MSDLRTQKDGADRDLSDRRSGRPGIENLLLANCLASGHQATVPIIRDRIADDPHLFVLLSLPIVPREEDRLYRFPHRLSRHHLVEVSI